jgi:hypothetical protein
MGSNKHQAGLRSAPRKGDGSGFAVECAPPSKPQATTPNDEDEEDEEDEHRNDEPAVVREPDDE